MAQVVGGQPLAQGLRVAVLSNVGGPAVLAVDACVSNGLQVPEFSAELQRQIVDLCPRNGGRQQPHRPRRRGQRTHVREGPRPPARLPTKSMPSLSTSPPTGQPADRRDRRRHRRRRGPRRRRQLTPARSPTRPRLAKPVVASLLGGRRSAQALESGQAVLRSARFPVPSYTYPETAVRALAHALRYAAWRLGRAGHCPSWPTSTSTRPGGACLTTKSTERRPGLAPGWVTGAAAMDVLAAFGVPVVRTVEAHSAEEAGKWADEIAGPVALKVLGPVHKSEGGGVRLGLVGHDAVVAAYDSMVDTFGEEMTGALLQPMVAGGVETIVGGIQDPSFGPLVVFGLGGITVEALGDHITRLAPLTDATPRKW